MNKEGKKTRIAKNAIPCSNRCCFSFYENIDKQPPAPKPDKYSLL